MSIRRYENGERIASREMIHAIAAALGEDPFNLMSWDQAAKAIEDDINVGIDARTRLDAAFDRLTGEGKKLVADVAEILASHPNYSQVIEEPPAREGNDTTPPPDAPETPPEGE